MPPRSILAPHSSHKHTSIRRIYIQNLTDLFHVCLLRGDIQRASRAWAILIRCREVDWKSRWQWGLQILQATSTASEGSAAPQITQTQTSTFQAVGSEGREAERWLKSMRISAKEADKPALLHALVLHLIKAGRYRAALEELETYLSSYPYLLSGALHTYAGLLCFCLAQPESARNPHPGSSSQVESMIRTQEVSGTRLAPSSSSRDTTPHSSVASSREPPNPSLLRQARGWLAKATEIEPRDEAAKEFMHLIDHPTVEAESDDGLMAMDDQDKEDEKMESGGEGSIEGGDDDADGDASEDDPHEGESKRRSLRLGSAQRARSGGRHPPVKHLNFKPTHPSETSSSVASVEAESSDEDSA